MLSAAGRRAGGRAKKTNVDSPMVFGRVDGFDPEFAEQFFDCFVLHSFVISGAQKEKPRFHDIGNAAVREKLDRRIDFRPMPHIREIPKAPWFLQLGCRRLLPAPDVGIIISQA